jgi:hypothetical protein
MDSHIEQPYVQEWNLGIQRQIGASNVLEVRYLGHRAVHQWISVDTNEVNIFENGFLKEFQAAQSNLKIYEAANPACLSAGTCNFGNTGLPGQVNLPIMSTAFGGAASSDFSNTAFVTDLLRGAAGGLASSLAYPQGNFPYICNLVGSSLSPCTGYGSTAPGAYPVNFLQSNPYLDSYEGGQSSSFLTAQGYGSYHALQVDFRQKQWHGMNFDVNYTYSHTLGLQPDNSWTGNTGVFTIRNMRLDYGPALFDLRHVVHASGTYDLPIGRGKTFLGGSNGLVDRFVGGWSLGTILTIQSGLPFQLYGGYDTYNDYGDGGLVLNGTSVNALQKAVGVYTVPGGATYKDILNPSLLTQSATTTCSSVLQGVCQNITPGTFGVHPWLYGPHMWNDDMSLSKAIPITERIQFRLQAEFLNIFNHPNWAIPGAGPNYVGGTNVQYSNFATATTQSMIINSPNGGARLIELRANISF